MATQDTPSQTLSSVDGDGLPEDIDQRDALLQSFWDKAIPVILGVMSEEDFIKIAPALQWLSTPFPYNPYREPGIDKSYLLPATSEEWSDILNKLDSKKFSHQEMLRFINNVFNFSSKSPENTTSLRVKTRDLKLMKHLFLIPKDYDEEIFDDYSVKTFNAQQPQQQTFFQDLDKDYLDAIRALADYHNRQLEKIEVMEKTMAKVANPDQFFKDLSHKSSPDYERASTVLEELRPYFLSPRKTVQKLMNIEALQTKSRRGAEVVVYEGVNPLTSRHLNLSQDQSLPPYEDNLDSPSHPTAVAGVIAGKESLEHLKGIVPGAKVLNVPDPITLENIEKIKRSKARVINMSIQHLIPKSCYGYFQARMAEERNNSPLASKRSTVEDPTGDHRLCENLWSFYKVIEEKDMILVTSGGNEGIFNKITDWETGITQYEADHSPWGLSYDNFNDTNFDSRFVPIFNIYKQIPFLKNRIVMVGDLLPDGVTIGPYSSLPGDTWRDYIFAPGSQIRGLYSSLLAIDKNTSHPYYSELGEFGGTSAASPRAAGVFVLLGEMFPDLPMTTIRECVLSTGDPFWKEHGNKFTMFKDAQNKEYLDHIFANGRINAGKAFARCQAIREQLDTKKANIAGLNLEERQGPDGSGILEALIHGKEDLIRKYYATHSPHEKLLDETKSVYVYPAEIAMDNGHDNIVSFLLKNTKFLRGEANKFLEYYINNKLQFVTTDEIGKNIIKELVIKKANFESIQLYTGIDLISAYLMQDDLEMAKFLIMNDCFVVIKDKSHRTLLHTLAVDGSDIALEKIRLLLNQPKALEQLLNDKNIFTPSHMTALHMAARTNAKTLALLLQNPYAKELLLRKGYLKDNEDGNTPLHLAASLNKEESVSVLLNDPMARDLLLVDDMWFNFFSDTPADLSLYRNPELAELLRKAKEDFNRNSASSTIHPHAN